MKALFFYDQRDLRLEACPDPLAGDNDVRIRVTVAGLSQTQVNEFIDGPFIINREPHPLTGKGMPLIPCQEFGGVVDQVGTGVDSALLGQQVAVLPLISCGTCDQCRRGYEHLCAQKAYCGLVGADGGFAEYAVVPAANVFPCPREDLLSFMEPILVAVHALQKVRHYCNGANGGRVLVLGAGAVGCAVGAVFQHYGQLDVVVADVLTERVDRAARIGLTANATEAVKGPFDVVVDAAGHDLFIDTPGLVSGMEWLRSGGTLISIGTYFQPIQWVPAQLLVGEFNIVTSFMYCSADVALLSDVIDSLPVSWSPLITRIPFEQIIEQGYYRAEVDKSSFTRLEVAFE